MNKLHTITLCGDTSLGDWYLKRAPEPIRERLNQNPMGFFSGVRGLINNSDLLILNLETVLWENPESPFTGKKPYLGWDNPARTISALKQLGVSAVSLANNHAMDFGAEGLARTCKTLEQGEIDYFGAGNDIERATQPLKLVIKGGGRSVAVYIIGLQQSLVKLRNDYEFYAAKGKPGVNPLSVKTVRAWIESLRSSEPDSIVIAYPHWGNNYKEITPRMRALAESLAECGVDLIVGHGAHMLQSVEQFKEATCVYSIGNFVFNSKGRYALLESPPYSLVTRIGLELTHSGLSGSIRMYPIVTDNMVTNYETRPVNEEEFQEVGRLLAAESRSNPDLQPGKDIHGYYFTFTKQISPRIAAMTSHSEPPPRDTKQESTNRVLKRSFLALETDKIAALFSIKDTDRYGEGSTQGCIATALAQRKIPFVNGGVSTASGRVRPAIHFQVRDSWYIVTGARILRSNQSGDVLGRLDGRSVAIVKNKDITKSLLRHAGFSVPEGECFSGPEKHLARLYFKSFEERFTNGFCMKPSSGGLGKDVHVGVRSLSHFENVFDSISRNGARVLIEEAVPGPVYRFLYVGGKVSAIRIGRPKSVLGDGASTISELVIAKNEARARNPLHKHYPLRLGRAEINFLEGQALKPNMVPRKGQRVFLSAVSNRHAGADVIDVTDGVHASYAHAVAAAVSAIPEIAVCGADVIIPDCSMPASASNYAIIELNTGPGFADHHFPWEGSSRDVAGDVVEMLLRS